MKMAFEFMSLVECGIYRVFHFLEENVFERFKCDVTNLRENG